jgi:hypothetical protein
MRLRRRADSGLAERAVSDLFAGFMIAMLLLLLVVWLHALFEAEQVKFLRRMANIFQEAFANTISDDDEDIIVDQDRGEIILKAEQLFPSGDWRFEPTPENLLVFVRIRSKIAGVLEEIDSGFEMSEDALGRDARDYVEVRVVGHTDCKPYRTSGGAIEDNLDLSTLRAAAVARFLTEPCLDGGYVCCLDGRQDSCSTDELTKRVSHEWMLFPMGRSYYEPRELGERQSLYDENHCREFTKKQLQDQRRVVIQMVPRLDKFVIQDMARRDPPS